VSEQDDVARGDLAEALILDAAGLAVAVREETREEIAARLAGLSRTELEALAVVLAALVDVERPLTHALGWVNFDEHGAPAPARTPVKPCRDRSIRDSAPRALLKNQPKAVDMVAIDQALAGRGRPLNQTERMVAVDRGIRAGMDYDQVAKALGMEKRAVATAWNRLKIKARAQGRYVPSEPVGQIVPRSAA
jgi:hypothetical protein